MTLLLTKFFATAIGKRLPPWLWEIIIAGVIILAGMLVHHAQVVKHDNGVRDAQKAADQKVLDQTVANYRAAQVQAKAQNDAQVRHVEQQYQRNSTDEREAYLRDLAKLRADRVRPQAPAAPGIASVPDAPAPDASAPRIDADGLCVPAGSDVCEAGAEIELRLMHLQNLYLQQVGVDPNK